MSFVHLATAFHAALEADGLDPDRLDPWSAWRAFKRFVRQRSEAEAEAVVVEVGPAEPDDGCVHLRFVRYFGIIETDEAIDAAESVEPEAVFQVECDLAFEPETSGPESDAMTLHDADFPSFESFVAAVEGHAAVQRLFSMEPTASAVTWREV